MDSLFNPQSKHGIMDEQPDFVHDLHHHDHISNSCSSSTTSIEEEEEEVNSSAPLQNMSSLLLQLPLKRGLSKYYNGKSQSFTSLSNVKSLEDLAKQENPYNKKLKICKSYGGLLSKQHTSSSRMKKPSNKGSYFSSHFDARKNFNFLGNNNNYDRPPISQNNISTSTSNLI